MRCQPFRELHAPETVRGSQKLGGFPPLIRSKFSKTPLAGGTFSPISGGYAKIGGGREGSRRAAFPSVPVWGVRPAAPTARDRNPERRKRTPIPTKRGSLLRPPRRQGALRGRRPSPSRPSPCQLPRPGAAARHQAGPGLRAARHPIPGAVSSSTGCRGDKSGPLIGRRPFRPSPRTPSPLREGRPRPRAPVPALPESPAASGPAHPRCEARL